MADLLAELRGESPKAPHFSVVLPAGWGEFEPSDSVQASFTARARERLMHAHRPDLYAELLGMTKRAFAGMQSAQTLKFYVQTEAWAEELFLPMSLTATLRRESPEVSLQAGVVDLIRRYQATPLGDDRRFVRWESESIEQFGSDSVAQFTVSYLTPVPGSGHTQALQFNAVALMPNEPGLTRAEPLLTSMFELTDAMVSTLTWDTP